MLYRFIRGLARVLLPLWYKIDYESAEQIPPEGGFILCCNHRSYIDPFFLAMKLKQQVSFMAKAEIFKWPVLGWIAHHVGAFPVERGKGDTGAVDWAVSLLKRGGVLAIFPEGTRSKDGAPLRPKSGAALIARMTEADVLPCAISFEGKLRFRSRITVKFGEIIKHDQLGFDDDTPSSLKKASKLIFGKTLALLGVAE